MLKTSQKKYVEVNTLSLNKTNLFSPIILDYSEGVASLKPFYDYEASVSGFKEYLSSKSFPAERRKVLTEHLEEQYRKNNIHPTETVLKNIRLLNEESTYTVTTGHQLNLFTGPLYFIYKIASAIQLARKLQKQFPDKNFVPVYWMASEDHDFDEINHFRLFKTKYEWNTKQTGAVGKIISDGMPEIIDSIQELPEYIHNAYAQGKSLSQATMEIVHHWFEKYGIIILDADSRQLKAEFVPIIKDEILNNKAEQEVLKSTSALTDLGYKDQVTPREINFFYLGDQFRSRIVREDAIYKVLDTDIEFNEESIISEIELHPERFSPNVIMRPVYQEYILPNLAYIGGPGEIHYWLQLKSCFEYYKIEFPILMLRDFILLLNKGARKKLEKLELNIEDLFKDFHELKKELVDKSSNTESIISEAHEGLNSVFENLLKYIDEEGTRKFIDSQRQNTLNQFKKVESKITKHFDSLNETSIRQLESLKDFAFPEGTPQERIENILNFSLNNPDIIDEIIQCCDPLDQSYKVLFI